MQATWFIDEKSGSDTMQYYIKCVYLDLNNYLILKQLFFNIPYSILNTHTCKQIYTPINNVIKGGSENLIYEDDI